MSLPAEMDLSHQVPNSAQARAVRINALPTNAQSFKSGSLCRIQIPRRVGSFLIPSGTFLTFDVVVDSTLISSTDANCYSSGTTGSVAPTSAGFAFDGHASSVISQVQTFHNSQQLEVLSGYNKLYNIMLETQVPREQKTGTGGTYSIAGLANDSRGDATYSTFNANDIIQTGTTVKVAFPLLSSIFGAGWNGNKYIPLDRLNSDLILEITFDDFRNGFKFWGKNTSAGAPYTAANTFYSTALPGVCNPANAVNHITIQNVQLVCQLVELDSATLGAYNSLHGSQIEIPVTQYRTYQTSMTAPLSSYSALVPARFQSVNALFHAFYDNVTVNSLTTGSNSWRTRAGLSTVAYRLGSLVYPPRPIS